MVILGHPREREGYIGNPLSNFYDSLTTVDKPNVPITEIAIGCRLSSVEFYTCVNKKMEYFGHNTTNASKCLYISF